MEQVLDTPYIWVLIAAGYALLTFTRGLIQNVIQEVSGIARTPVEKVQQGATTLDQELQQRRASVEGLNEKLTTALSEVLTMLAGSFKSISTVLRGHLTSVLAQVAPDAEHRSTQVLGSLFFLISAVLLLFTDLGQNANAITVLIPGEYVPPVLRNIVIPLGAASAGSALILGMILFDLLRYTHFDTWDRFTGFLRALLIGVVVTNFIAVLVCATLLSLVRYGAIVEPFDIARLPRTTNGMLYQLAALSQSIVIIPLLMTTALLVRAPMGLLTVYGMVIGLVVLMLEMMVILAHVLKTLVGSLGMVSFGALLKLFLFFLHLTLIGIAGFFSGALTVLSHIVNGVCGLFTAVTQPLAATGAVIQHVLYKRWPDLQSLAQPAAGSHGTYPSINPILTQVGEDVVQVQSVTGSHGTLPRIDPMLHQADEDGAKLN